jgi:hypothetical protein
MADNDGLIHCGILGRFAPSASKEQVEKWLLPLRVSGALFVVGTLVMRAVG